MWLRELGNTLENCCQQTQFSCKSVFICVWHKVAADPESVLAVVVLLLPVEAVILQCCPCGEACAGSVSVCEPSLSGPVRYSAATRAARLTSSDRRSVAPMVGAVWVEAAAHSARQPLQQHVGVVTETERAKRHSAIWRSHEHWSFICLIRQRDTECDSPEASVSLLESRGG